MFYFSVRKDRTRCVSGRKFTACHTERKETDGIQLVFVR